MQIHVEIQFLIGRRHMRSPGALATIALWNSAPMSAEMRRRLCEDVIKQKKKMSILIDESTTVTRLSVATIHLRTAVRDSDEHVTFILDLIELHDTTAAFISETLLA